MAALSKVLVQVTEQSILRWMRECERETEAWGGGGLQQEQESHQQFQNYNVRIYNSRSVNTHTQTHIHKQTHTKTQIPRQKYRTLYISDLILHHDGKCCVSRTGCPSAFWHKTDSNCWYSWVKVCVAICFLTFANECKNDEKKLWKQLSDGLLLCKFLCQYMCLKHVKLFPSEGNWWFCIWRKSEAVNTLKISLVLIFIWQNQIIEDILQGDLNPWNHTVLYPEPHPLTAV